MMKKAKLFIVPALCLFLVSCGNGSDSAQQEDPSDIRMQEDEMPHDEHLMDEDMPHDEMRYEDEHMMQEDTIHDNMMDGDTVMRNDTRHEGV